MVEVVIRIVWKKLCSIDLELNLSVQRYGENFKCLTCEVIAS